MASGADNSKMSDVLVPDSDLESVHSNPLVVVDSVYGDSEVGGEGDRSDVLTPGGREGVSPEPGRSLAVSSGRISPALSIADSLRSSVRSEELEAQKEIRRMELEAEERRLQSEREARREEREAEERRLRHEREAEDRREERRFAHEREMADRHRAFELERARITSSVSRSSGGEGEGDGKVESRMVRSLKLIPEFDEKKVAEWFKRFERKYWSLLGHWRYGVV